MRQISVLFALFNCFCSVKMISAYWEINECDYFIMNMCLWKLAGLSLFTATHNHVYFFNFKKYAIAKKIPWIHNISTTSHFDWFFFSSFFLNNIFVCYLLSAFAYLLCEILLSRSLFFLFFYFVFVSTSFSFLIGLIQKILIKINIKLNGKNNYNIYEYIYKFFAVFFFIFLSSPLVLCKSITFNIFYV